MSDTDFGDSHDFAEPPRGHRTPTHRQADEPLDDAPAVERKPLVTRHNVQRSRSATTDPAEVGSPIPEQTNNTETENADTGNPDSQTVGGIDAFDSSDLPDTPLDLRAPLDPDTPLDVSTPLAPTMPPDPTRPPVPGSPPAGEARLNGHGPRNGHTPHNGTYQLNGTRQINGWNLASGATPHSDRTRPDQNLAVGPRPPVNGAAGPGAPGPGAPGPGAHRPPHQPTTQYPNTHHPSGPRTPAHHTSHQTPPQRTPIPAPPNGFRGTNGTLRPPTNGQPFPPNGAVQPPTGLNGRPPAPQPAAGPRYSGVHDQIREIPLTPQGPLAVPPQPRIPTPPPGARRSPIPVDPRLPAHHTGPLPTAGQLKAYREQTLAHPPAPQQHPGMPSRLRRPDTDYAVVVENLRKSYGSVDALRGISFTVERGEVLAVLGPNGAGKTTTVDILCTLNKPTSGTALIDGYDVVDDAPAVRRSIMLTGQQVALDDMLTGRENLVMFGRLQGMRKAMAKQRAEELLDQFDLQYAADRRIGTFSGGMRRRIDIACGLVVRPAVVFLDEPTTGLDPRSRQNVWDLVARFKEQGITTLLTTQYLEEADALSDRIVVIDRGTVIAEGTADQLKERTGATHLEIVPRNPADIPRILTMLAPMQPRTVRNVMTGVDDRVGMPAPQGPRTLLTAAAQLDAAGVPLIDIGLRRPSLDEVFFALTGDNAPKPAEDEQN